MDIPSHIVQQAIERALEEDLGHGDVTTDSLIPTSLTGKGVFLAKAEGTLAGMPVALAVFRHLDSTLKLVASKKEGATFRRGESLGTIEGSLSSILKAERTALNFLQRLSGIATETHHYVQAIHGTKARIIDTRKTTPGLRALEKYAVRVGGGHNHRFHLADGILIKDNHLAALRAQGKGIKEAVALAREKAPHNLKVEIEVTDLEELKEALDSGADIIMLDNMGLESMRRAVALAQGKAILEASGGITLDTVRAVAETGVDLIAVGAITHSARALDISLEVSPSG